MGWWNERGAGVEGGNGIGQVGLGVGLDWVSGSVEENVVEMTRGASVGLWKFSRIPSFVLQRDAGYLLYLT